MISSLKGSIRKMAGYEPVFARYYDSLTADVDYPGMAGYLFRLAERYRGRPRLMLDLGCGTGSLSVELARLGAEVIAVDASREMLSCAAAKGRDLEKPVLYLCQEMEELDLYGTVDTAVEAQVCAAETLLVGQVPDAYLELAGSP